MTTLQEILTAAQALAPSDRAQLIARLWDDASPEDWVAPGQDWMEAANRRSDDVETGDLKVSPWSEVRERARRKAGLDG